MRTLGSSLKNHYPEKIKLVISDIHLGEGQKPGDYNPWDDFHHDKKLCDFLEYYSSGKYGDHYEVELIIAGDFVDFLQIQHRGEFSVAITEDVSVAKLQQCIEGHRAVWNALKNFLTRPGKTLTILPGNHDLDFYFPKVRETLIQEVAGHSLSHKIKFCLENGYYFDRILIQHGHEYEIMNRFEDQEPTFVGPLGEPMLNLPFGSFYHIMVLNPLKLERPYINKVHPLKLYFLRSLFLDTRFALKFILKSIQCLIQTRFRSFLGRKASLKNTLKIIQEAILIYSGLERHVQKIFQEREDVDIVILGHSHGPRVRRFGENKLYFNSGTWTESVGLDLPALGTKNCITYVLIQYLSAQKLSVHLMSWNGFYSVTNEIRF